MNDDTTAEDFQRMLETRPGEVYRTIVKRADEIGGDPRTLPERLPMPEFVPALRQMAKWLEEDLRDHPEVFRGVMRDRSGRARDLLGEVSALLDARQVPAYGPALRVWNRYLKLYTGPGTLENAWKGNVRYRLMRAAFYERFVRDAPNRILLPMPSQDGQLALETFLSANPYFFPLGAMNRSGPADGKLRSPWTFWNHDLWHAIQQAVAIRRTGFGAPKVESMWSAILESTTLTRGRGPRSPMSTEERLKWSHQVDAMHAVFKHELAQLPVDKRRIATHVAFDPMHEVRFERGQLVAFEPRALRGAIAGREELWAEVFHREMTKTYGECPYTIPQIVEALRWLVGITPAMERAMTPGPAGGAIRH